MDKIAIIKEIVKLHPSIGTKKGWSEYTGGMKDSGTWFWDKMIDIPTNELQDFLHEQISNQLTNT